MKYVGEVRNDSPGHRAKYCIYAMMNNSKKKEKKKEHNYWESLFSESHKRDARHSLSELSRSGKKKPHVQIWAFLSNSFHFILQTLMHLK